MTVPRNSREAYKQYDNKLTNLIMDVRDRVEPEADLVRASTVALTVLLKTTPKYGQLCGMLATLIAQVACGGRHRMREEDTQDMALWFSRRSNPEPTPPPPPPSSATVDDEAAILRKQVTAAETALVRLLTELRLRHSPTAGVDLTPCIDAALDVRNALRPRQPAMQERAVSR